MGKVICTCSTCIQETFIRDGQCFRGREMSSESQRRHEIRDRRATSRVRHSIGTSSTPPHVPEELVPQAIGASFNIDLGQCKLLF